MKTTKRYSQIVIAAMLAVMMLFSIFAVSSFAAEEANEQPDISGVTFENKTVQYDGNEHSIVIGGDELPSDVTVTYSPARSEVGTHIMTASFSVGNAEPFAIKTALLVILPTEVSGIEFGYSVDGISVFEAVAKNPLGTGVDVSFVDKSADYKKFDFGSVVEEGKITFGAAYDISFTKDGASYDVGDNVFTVRLLIPTELKLLEGITVVHIGDDNTAELVEAERDGNYMIFETSDFSVYSIIDVNTEKLNLLWLWILLGVLGVIAAVVVVLIIIKKRGNGKGGDSDEKPVDNNNSEGSDDKAALTENVSDAEQTFSEETPAVEIPVEQTSVETSDIKEESVADEADFAESVVDESENSDSPVVVGYDDTLAVDGNVVFIKFRRSVTARLIQSAESVQNYYGAIKNYILSYAGIASEVTFDCEYFVKENTRFAKIDIKGESVNLNLSELPMLVRINDEDSLKNAYALVDELMGNAGIEQGEIPSVDYRMPYQSNSQLAMSGLVKVILPTDVVINENSILREITVDEVQPDEIVPEEVESAEVVEEPAVEEVAEEPAVEEAVEEPAVEEVAEEPAVEEVAEEPAVEEVAEEPAVEEVAEEPAVEEVIEEKPEEEIPVAEAAFVEEVPSDETAVEEAVSEPAPEAEASVEEPKKTDRKIGAIPVVSADDNVIVNGEAVSVRYRSSFMSRLIQAETEVQDYYTVLKNYILSFKGVKARTSFNYEAFNKGRIQCVRLNVKGKALLVNLALAPANYNINKYHFTDMSDDPRYDKLPMLLKVRSERALKYAIELIDELMHSQGIPKGKAQNVDYHMPYEPNCELAKRGLVKLILPKGVKLEDVSVLVESDVSEIISSDSESDNNE